MRAVISAVAALLVVTPGLCFAQAELSTLTPPPTIAPPPAASSLPVLSSAEPEVLPGGAAVSQPLQPVVIPTTPVPDVNPPPGFAEIPCCPPEKPKKRKILGGVWGSDDILMWYPKSHPVPSLVTATKRGSPPILGRANTLTLVGNQAIDNQMIMGYRTLIGYSLNEEDTVGIEGSYFFLGTRTASFSMSDFAAPRYQTIGLPFVNALTGEEDVLTVASPGVSSALVTVSTTTRMQGAEMNGIANLYASDNVRLHALVGYRFYQLQEGLRVEQTWLQYGTAATAGHTTIGAIADQFSTSNRFNGGQLGFLFDAEKGPVYLEVGGKVALGQNYEVLRTQGETHLITYGTNPLPLVRSYLGGVYVQPTNQGRLTHSAFAVLPEGTFKVGLKSQRHRFFVGYNFLYLNDVIRPGDQVDRTLNPTQIPLMHGGHPATGPDRPQFAITRGDFWVQGLIVGWESRY